MLFLNGVVMDNTPDYLSLFIHPDDHLAHYGTLGMKWGVRKDRQQRQDNAGKGRKASLRKIRKIDKKFEKTATKKWFDWQNKSADLINKQIKTFNSNPKWATL